MNNQVLSANKPSPLSDDYQQQKIMLDPRFGEITIFQNQKSGDMVMQKEKISYKEEDRDRDVFQA